MIICDLKSAPTPRVKCLKGACAMCGAAVYEAEVTLDDAYMVWLGRCPECKALNFLDLKSGGRGYSSRGMNLCLPTENEKALNKLPADCPTKN